MVDGFPSIGRKSWMSAFARSRAVELFFLSVASLLIELVVIRWMSSDVRAFSVFKTFPLIACFIGLGVGYASAKDELYKFTPLLMLIFVGIMRLADIQGVSLMPFPSMSVFYWHDLVTSTTQLWFTVGVFMLVLLYLLLGPFYLMVCLGTRLGRLFNEQKPLEAYCLNIAGAVVGSVIFTLMSFLDLPPWLLLVLPAAIVIYYLDWSAGSKRIMITAVAPVVAAVVIAATAPPLGEGGITYWSPYQRIDLIPIRIKFVERAGLKAVDFGYQLCVNKVGYQVTISDHPPGHKEYTLPDNLESNFQILQRRFSFPYKLKKPGDVLVVGSGLGSDVTYGIKLGAEHIDAVEIDPLILKLGKSVPLERPYDSPKVQVYLNDARNFFKTCRKKYDLIVFSHLDSHVTTAGSSVRIDNYVYTKESFKEISRILKPDGLVVISYFSFKDWFTARLVSDSAT